MGRKFQGAPPITKVVYAAGQPATIVLRSCRLRIKEPGASEARDAVVDKDVISIGTRDDNDVVVRDDTVSRNHCRIIQEEGHHILQDLGSTNGTFLEGVRIREAFLEPGHVITVGNTEIRFQPFDERIQVVPSVRDRCGDIIAQNIKMREVFTIIEKIAPTNATVVIEGETGTGKEVVAQTIHQLSPRAKMPFVVFDGGAVPDNLIESELFGHEKGSFTGAITSRQGLFEMAHGGTIFLDELTELALDLQPKLLRVLEGREVRRVGSNKPIRVDVRVIAATNRNLEAEVKAGRFREDLFYRLSVVRIFLPPLRERKEDIPLLVRHFLRTHPANRGTAGEMKVKGFSRAAHEALLAYDWPGNIRELVNVIERACSFAESDRVELADLPEHIARLARVDRMAGGVTRPPPAAPAPALPPPAEATTAGAAAGAGEGPPLPEGEDSGEEEAGGLELDDVPGDVRPEARPDVRLSSGVLAARTFKDAKEQWVASFERDYILQLLRRNNMNISHAAREADIDRKYFRKLMRKYGIDTGNE